MAWIEVHQSLPTHAKTVEAAALLDVPEVEVVGHMVCLWLWAVDNAREGRINVAKPLVIAKAAKWAGEPGRFVDALLAAGFMDEDGCIHDWDEYTGRLMERRERVQEQTRARVQKWRENRRLSSIDVRNANSNALPVTPVTLGNAPTVPNPTVPNHSSTTPVGRGRAADADAPAPLKPRGNAKVSAVIDALRAEGMTGTLTARDAKAVKDVEHDPAQVAALYAAIFRGEYGDDWMHKNLSVALCLEKLPGWLSHQAGHAAPAPRRNKPLSGAAAVDAVFGREGIDLGSNGSGRGRPDLGLGHAEAGGGVPRQLRG